MCIFIVHMYVRMHICIYVHTHIRVFTGVITQGPSNVTYFPGQPDIRLTCTVTSGVPVWVVNGTITITLNQLDNPNNMMLPRHSRIGTDIIIEAPPANSTSYRCEVSVTVNDTFVSDTAFVYVAGE